MAGRALHLLGSLIIAAMLLLPCRAFAQAVTLERPGERDFILDKANLINEADEQHIKAVCDKLLTDTASPIIVVTIESMSKYTARQGMTIESFARTLFDQWGIGHLVVNGQPSNTGLLLLVSRDDRRARIELGIGWSYEKEAISQQIMNGRIVPRFKQGDYSSGIRDGVESLDQMARGMAAAGATTGGGSSAPTSRAAPSTSHSRSSMPSPAQPSFPGRGAGPAILGCGGLTAVVPILIVIGVVLSRVFGGGMSRFGRGSRWYGGSYGRGWYGHPGMWGMGGMHGGTRGFGGFGGGGGSGGFGGGFSGGSFGGGFSGGRGASGSW